MYAYGVSLDSKFIWADNFRLIAAYTKYIIHFLHSKFIFFYFDCFLSSYRWLLEAGNFRNISWIIGWIQTWKSTICWDKAHLCTGQTKIKSMNCSYFRSCSQIPRGISNILGWFRSCQISWFLSQFIFICRTYFENFASKWNDFWKPSSCSLFCISKASKVNGLAKYDTIEVNPISNQVLNLVEDFRYHLASVLLSHSVSVVISSDDPLLWETYPLTHDLYIFFLSIASHRSDLRTLGKFAINSIRHQFQKI